MKTSKVGILLAAYNGEKYLEKQLASYVNQTKKEWVLYVSDDSNNNETFKLIEEFRGSTHNRVYYTIGPQQGATRNFISLLVNDNINEEIYACSDQDDIWKSDKLERAIDIINSYKPNTPVLYCSRTELIDADGVSFGYSRKLNRLPSFNNALVQSLAGGNTMVFNNSARSLIKRSIINHEIPAHDWWIYLIVSGAGGIVYYDLYPSVLYRQHPLNLVGHNTGMSESFKRVYSVFRGDLRDNISKNVIALNAVRTILTNENAKKLDNFIIARNSNLPARIYKFYHLKLYRQRVVESILLIIATIFNLL
jgi:glycosyltransferase involved in cell wall biosynthesis